jgi:hypothetical protein
VAFDGPHRAQLEHLVVIPVPLGEECTGDRTDDYGEVVNTNGHLDLLSHNLAVRGRKWSL